MNVPGPRFAVREHHERVHRPAVLHRLDHRQRAVRSPERQGRDAAHHVVETLTRRDHERRESGVVLVPVRRRPPPRGHPRRVVALRERNEAVLRLRCGRHERHRRRRLTTRQVVHPEHRRSHRAGDVECQHDPLARRGRVVEREVERAVERIDHLRHRRPLPASLHAASLRVGLHRGEHRNRVHARATQGLVVRQPVDDLSRRVARRREQSHLRHDTEVTNHCRQRHSLEQRLPHVGVSEQLGRDHLTRQLHA